MQQLDTDLDSHHIQGYARAAQEKGERGFFRVPLISQIDATLWTGGCRPGIELPEDFEFVVSLYPWQQFEISEKTSRLEVQLYDTSEIPDEDKLYAIALAVNAFRKVGKTLVHCQAGLNRSALIAALALIIDGSRPDDAIRLLRAKRCDMVLCNQTFENWLLEQ